MKVLIPLLKTADGIGSDYEHARVLMMITSRSDVSPAATAMALRSATRIKSDYDRKRALAALGDQGGD